MPELEFHPGERAKVKLTLFDEHGNPGASYDEAVGVEWRDTAEQIEIVDPDEDPLTAEVIFHDITEPGVDQYVGGKIDAKQGDATNELTFTSKSLHVVAGEARTGTLELELIEEEPETPAA